MTMPRSSGRRAGSHRSRISASCRSRKAKAPASLETPTALFLRGREPFDYGATPRHADPHNSDLLEPKIDERLRRIPIEHDYKEKQHNVTRCLDRNRVRKEPRPETHVFGCNLP